jgi:hypothetical protein
MMIAVRGNRWHLALSMIQKELGVEQPSRTRKLVDYVLHGLSRDVPDGADAGSTLVVDLPMPWGESSDVVVSWADSKEQLRKEVDSIRSCLDALGIFNTEEQHRLQELHADHLPIGVGDVSVQLDRDKHLFSATGNFKVGRILAWLGHAIPGMGKTEIGGTINLRLPYQDSREKFIAALMALQWQSSGKLRTCSELQLMRGDWRKSDLTPEQLQAQWEKAVLPAREFLEQSLAAIDREMRRAFSVHPVGGVYELSYDLILRSMKSGHFEDAVETLPHIQYPGPVIRRAMGENYYLFAANVIMQAQIAWFERDLEQVLKERFGQALRRCTVDEASVTTASRSSVEPPATQAGSEPPSAGSRLRRPRP